MATYGGNPAWLKTHTPQRYMERLPEPHISTDNLVISKQDVEWLKNNIAGQEQSLSRRNQEFEKDTG